MFFCFHFAEQRHQRDMVLMVVAKCVMLIPHANYWKLKTLLELSRPFLILSLFVIVLFQIESALSSLFVPFLCQD